MGNVGARPFVFKLYIMSPTVFQEYTTRPVDCIPETGTYITHNATDWRKFDQITYSFF